MVPQEESNVADCVWKAVVLFWNGFNWHINDGRYYIQ